MNKRIKVYIPVILSILLLPFYQTTIRAEEAHQKILAEVNNVVSFNTSNLNSQTLSAIRKLLKQNNENIKQPKVIDALVITGAGCLDKYANWTDREKGRQVYNVLKRLDDSLTTDSLIRQVLKSHNRLKVLFLSVKLGTSGSQEKLNKVLMKHGDKSMAEDFLNSGSQKLFEGGKKWANAHGYFISTGMGSHRVAWGRF